jgi:hypothetical protein
MITPARYTSGWESGCGPADPAISNINTTGYSTATATGYGPVGKGTIGVGTPGTVQATAPPAQVRFYMSQDGNLYILDNNNKAYVVQASAVVPVPAIYSPTK